MTREDEARCPKCGARADELCRRLGHDDNEAHRGVMRDDEKAVGGSAVSTSATGSPRAAIRRFGRNWIGPLLCRFGQHDWRMFGFSVELCRRPTCNAERRHG